MHFKLMFRWAHPSVRLKGSWYADDDDNDDDDDDMMMMMMVMTLHLVPAARAGHPCCLRAVFRRCNRRHSGGASTASRLPHRVSPI